MEIDNHEVSFENAQEAAMNNMGNNGSCLTRFPVIQQQRFPQIEYQKKERARNLLENSILFNLNRVKGTKNSAPLRKGNYELNIKKEISRRTGVPE